MQYYTCPYCQANLDPGEKCDCMEQRRKKEAAGEEAMKRILPLLAIEKDGQLRLAV